MRICVLSDRSTVFLGMLLSKQNLKEGDDFMTHAPGKALLKIVGILFIIFSLVTIIVALVGIFSGTAMACMH